MNSVIVPASVTVTAKVQSKTFRCKVMLILSWVSDWQADCFPLGLLFLEHWWFSNELATLFFFKWRRILHTSWIGRYYYTFLYLSRCAGGAGSAQTLPVPSVSRSTLFYKMLLGTEEEGSGFWSQRSFMVLWEYASPPPPVTYGFH